MKLLPRDLNLNSYSPHPMSTYTCVVTIVPRVCNGKRGKQNQKNWAMAQKTPCC